jgi:hypothetical protein
MKKPFSSAVVTGASLVLLAAPVSASTPPPPFVLTFTGHAYHESAFAYHFTVPADHRFAVAWHSSPYHGDAPVFTLDVGAYSDPNKIPCNSPKSWCRDPNEIPLSGTHNLFSFGSGRFAIGVMGQEDQWVVTVIITQDPSPTVVYSDKGNGPNETHLFAVRASAPWWQVNWSYNCHPSGSANSSDWAVYTPIRLDVFDNGADQIGWGFTAATRYYDHGTFYLDINTMPGCVWTIQVITPPGEP